MATSGKIPPAVQTPWKERWKNPCLRWSVIVAAAVLFLLGLFFYPEQPEFRVRSLVARTTPSKDRPVEVEARLDTNLLEEKGASDELQVTVTNREPATAQEPVTLSGLTVEVQAQGFDVKKGPQPCEQKGTTPAALERDQSCTAQIKLTTLERSWTSAVTVLVDYKGGDAQQEISLALGPVKVDGPFGAARWNRLGRRLAQVLRDLAIPIVLALIGIWFNRAQNKRADRQQVRVLLLKTVMDLEKNHYLPIVSVTVSILTQVNKGGQPIDRDKLFFYVLMLLKRMDHLKRKEGGVFFEKRPGEYAAHHAWLILREAMYGVLSESSISNALTNTVGIQWEYANFLRAEQQLRPLREQFEKWLAEPGQNSPKDHPSLIYGQFKRYLGVLDAIQAIFRFEGDRPLSEGWYEEEAKINFRSEGDISIPTFKGDVFPEIQKNAAALKQKIETVYGHTVKLDEIR